jgi:MOSC domain-containing protein YiiM
MTGRLAGIARHARPKARMELIERADVTPETGIAGDFRGAVKPGGRGRRQITLIERRQWDVAMAELGRDIPWQERRANLLVDGVSLPRERGALVRIGADVVVRITGECDPCSRMESVAPGLKAVLLPDWRGGVTAKVINGGRIAIDDQIRIEEP